MADFSIMNHGSIVTLTPTSAAGHEWIAQYIPETSMRWGACSIVVEPRFVNDIVDGITAEGLSLG